MTNVQEELTRLREQNASLKQQLIIAKEKVEILKTDFKVQRKEVFILAEDRMYKSRDFIEQFKEESTPYDSLEYRATAYCMKNDIDFIHYAKPKNKKAVKKINQYPLSVLFLISNNIANNETD